MRPMLCRRSFFCTDMLKQRTLRSRAKAAAWHVLVSAAIAALAATLVFAFWYPGPYRLFSGGQSLFFLLTGVDVVMGPLLTFVVFDLKKGWPHLRRDLAVIGALQFTALVYGLYTVYEARPIAMVFEVDRFRVIAAVDVYTPELDKARPEYRSLPATGPWLLGTRAARAGQEQADALFKGVAGVDIGQRPIFWQPYADSMKDAAARARPVERLLKQYPQRESELRKRLLKMKADPSTARFLPLVARGDWVAILDTTGVLLGYLQVDGFF